MKLQHLSFLLYAYALFWVFFAVAWYLRDSNYRYMYSSIGAGYAVGIFLLTYFVRHKKQWAWWLTTILVGLTILVSLLDEIGWVDVAYLLFSGMVLVSLLQSRRLVSR